MRLAALAACVLLVGCATDPSSHLAEGKALTDAYTSVGVMAQTLDVLAVSGKLKGQDAAKAKALLDKANASVLAAESAYRAGNDASAATNVALTVSLTAQIAAIVAQ